MDHSAGEAVSCFSSFMSAQDWPGTQGLFRDKEKWENRDECGNRELLREKEASKRGDAKAVPKAEKKQLARRCVCPIFSFPHAHLKLHTAAGAFAHE